MNDAHLPTRLGAIGAVAAGAGVATGIVLLDHGRERDVHIDRRPALATAGAGVAALVAGSGAARWSEQALRPGIARAGRTTAAVGAALVAGAALGTMGVELIRGLDARRRVDAASTRLAAERDRAANPSTTDVAARDLAATRALVEDYDPAPPDGAPRLPASDPRMDIGDAPVASVAKAIMGAYDTNDSWVLWRAEQQRVVDGRTLSIASLIHHGRVDAGSGRSVADVPALEDILAARVDRAHEGTPGAVDAAEAEAWYGAGSIGEKDITWNGEDAETARFFARPAIPAEDASWTLGAYAAKTGPILYLTDVADEAAAVEVVRTLVDEKLPSPVLVRLPDDAPARFGVVSLLHNGERSATRPDQASMPTLLAPGDVVAIANRQGVFTAG